MTRHLATLSICAQKQNGCCFCRLRLHPSLSLPCGSSYRLHTLLSCGMARPLSQLLRRKSQPIPLRALRRPLPPVHTGVDSPRDQPPIKRNLFSLIVSRYFQDAALNVEAFPVPGYVAADRPQSKEQRSDRLAGKKRVIRAFLHQTPPPLLTPVGSIFCFGDTWGVSRERGETSVSPYHSIGISSYAPHQSDSARWCIVPRDEDRTTTCLLTLALLSSGPRLSLPLARYALQSLNLPHSRNGCSTLGAWLRITQSQSLFTS